MRCYVLLISRPPRRVFNLAKRAIDLRGVALASAWRWRPTRVPRIPFLKYCQEQTDGRGGGGGAGGGQHRSPSPVRRGGLAVWVRAGLPRESIRGMIVNPAFLPLGGGVLSIGSVSPSSFFLLGRKWMGLALALQVPIKPQLQLTQRRLNPPPPSRSAAPPASRGLYHALKWIASRRWGAGSLAHCLHAFVAQWALCK